MQSNPHSWGEAESESSKKTITVYKADIDLDAKLKQIELNNENFSLSPDFSVEERLNRRKTNLFKYNNLIEKSKQISENNRRHIDLQSNSIKNLDGMLNSRTRYLDNAYQVSNSMKTIVHKHTHTVVDESYSNCAHYAYQPIIDSPLTTAPVNVLRTPNQHRNSMSYNKERKLSKMTSSAKKTKKM